MERRARVVRAAWAVCLVLAGLNHTRTLILHGLFWDYGGVSRASAAYWSSLAIVDPLVAGLLLARPRIGVVAAAFLIATNVGNNLAVTAWYAPPGEFPTTVASDPILLSQVAFLTFVAVTFGIAMRDVRRGGEREFALSPARQGISRSSRR